LDGGSEVKYFMSFGYDFFIGPENYPKAFAGMKDLLNDFSMKFLNDYYASEASVLTKKIKKLEKEINSNERSVKKNNKKAKKESFAVASGLDAKNNSLLMENDRLRAEIQESRLKIEEIKIKQNGITRN
jgi:hypothetical protein